MDDGYVANGTFYGSTITFSDPFANMVTKPFKVSLNKLYNFMLQRCLNRHIEPVNDNLPLDLVLMQHMRREIQATNPLLIYKSNDTFYFTEANKTWSIGKYESN